MLEKERNKGDLERNYRSCVNTTMSFKGHHTKCWVSTQPIKEVSPSPLVGEGARRAGEGVPRGFTLIELLVVVLIIGILAAVALPQYQRAVEKARVVQLFTALRALAAAEETYHLANGKYTTYFSDLDVDIPRVGGTAENGTLKSGGWVSLGAVNTKIHGYTDHVKIEYFLNHSNEKTSAKPGMITCMAPTDDATGTAICSGFSNGVKAFSGVIGCGTPWSGKTCYRWMIRAGNE